MLSSIWTHCGSFGVVVVVVVVALFRGGGTAPAKGIIAVIAAALSVFVLRQVPSQRLLSDRRH
jgi:hypothetical protein